MADNIIIDTGPLFALFNSNDQYHYWAAKQIATVGEPLITCEAVLSETLFLMLRSNINTELFFTFIDRGDLVITPICKSKHALHRIGAIIKNYDNLPASFADACLVTMAENTRAPRVFTLDSDFHIYRTQSGAPLSLIIPS